MDKILVPAFYKEFHCIGGNCELNCCHGWNITIDKKVYQKYVSCPDRELRKKLMANLKRVSGKGNVAYAEIEHKENNCPFLMEDGFCELQRKLGEDYLSNTCATYPREKIRLGDQISLSIRMSCPEAVRVALPGEPIVFEYIDDPEAIPVSKRLNFRNDAERDFTLSVRDLQIDILQNQGLPFESRLIFMGMFTKKIVDNPPDHKGIIKTYASLIDDPVLPDMFASLPNIPDMKFELINSMLAVKMTRQDVPEYRTLSAQTLDGLRAKADLSQEERYRHYLDAESNYLKTAGQWDSIFENYFVNDVFLGVQKYRSGEAIWGSYMVQCYFYLLMKFHFIGMYNRSNALSEADITFIISVLERSYFTHNSQFTKNTIDFLKKRGYNTLAHMAAIIKD